MGFPFFLLGIIATPFIEIALYIRIGEAIGVGPTILLTIATSALGFFLVRCQGLANMMKVRESLAANKVPVQEMFDNACAMLGGILMIVPGFLTDVLGLLLFIPRVQAFLRHSLEKSSRFHVDIDIDAHPVHRREDDPTILEADYVDVTDQKEISTTKGQK